MKEFISYVSQLFQIIDLVLLLSSIIAFQLLLIGYLIYRVTKYKTINDKKKSFDAYIEHSHILLYLRNNAKNLYHFLSYIKEEDLEYVLLNEGNKMVKRLGLMRVNGLINDLNTYLAEYYKKDLKNLKKLNRLNKKIRVKELKIVKKQKSNFSKNFYLTYFELRKLKRKHNKHQYFDRQKVKTSYKEFKI